jgi:predicted phosphodiesterase
MIRSGNDLGEHLFSFAVISDTHINHGEEITNSAFAVNARANRRFRHIIADLRRRDISFVIHLGDLVHPVPETGVLYAQAAEAYRAIESDLNVPINYVPGNHDIGDTPVRGAPAKPSTDAMIESWKKEFGKQYQSFIHDGVRFILLNAQLINSGLTDESKQKEWVEAELAKDEKRKFLMLHHPVFLCHPDEPEHYDNTDQPGRDWLLDLMKKYNVEAIFSGHSHNFWYNRVGTIDYYLAPAICFVRLDFSEMQRQRPPEGSEHGRNDSAKLGYFLVKVHANGHTVQFVRSFGAELGIGEAPKELRNLAKTPRENDRPLIGFDLRQNWSEIVEIAPSGGLDEFDRKPVRNDYPLLSLIEMGVRDIRIPMADLRDPIRRKRLGSLCHLGLRPTIFTYGVPGDTDLKLIEESRHLILDWEMTVDWPEVDDMRAEIGQAHARTGLPIYLSRMHTKQDVPIGAVYHHVINHGFAASDASQLDQLAQFKGIGIQGAIFRLDDQCPTVSTLQEIDDAAHSRGLRASVHLRVAGENPAIAQEDNEAISKRMEEAVATMPSLKATRLFCDTLVDHDRGYFPRKGAIDRTGNPNPLLEVVRRAHE